MLREVRLMWASALVGSWLLALIPASSPAPSADDLKAYESASARAGRDPRAHVELALWCERHGLDVERTRHLAMAVLIDPDHAAARGLLGLVKHEGKWQAPEKVGERIRADQALASKLAEYNARRDAL